MSYGLYIPASVVSSVMDYCDKNHIRYELWNAEEMLYGDTEVAEVNFDTEQDREQVKKLFL